MALSKAVIEELRGRTQTWHSKMEHRWPPLPRPPTPEYSSDSEMFGTRSWSNQNRKSRGSATRSMLIENAFVDFSEEAAEYLCTPQLVTKEGTLQLEMRTLSGKKKHQQWKDYNVQLIMATSYQVETFGKKRFFLHCSTSAGRLGLSKRRFLTIPFTEITDLESKAERVARGVLFSFKTSQYKMLWCASDREELDTWMAEMRASLAWENTGGSLPTLFHIRLTPSMSGSSSEPLSDALLTLLPRDKPEQLVVTKPITGSLLCQYPLHDIRCVGHEIDGSKLSIELQNEDSPTEGIERLTLHCPNHWRDDVLQALLCNVQRISGGVQCCRRDTLERQHVMYYVTGQHVPVPQLHQYEEVVLTTNHRPPKQRKESGEKHPKKKAAHSYEKVDSGNFATRMRRQFSDLNHSRIPAIVEPSTRIQRTRSESELTVLSCTFQRKSADLPPTPGTDQTTHQSRDRTEIERLRIQMELNGRYSRPRPAVRYVPPGSHTAHTHHTPVAESLYSRPRTPVVPARSACFQEALLDLYQTPRSVTPDGRSLRGNGYELPRNATIPRATNEERETTDYHCSHAPFLVYNGGQSSSASGDADSGCGSSSSVNTNLSPMGGPKAFEASGDDEEVAFYNNLVRSRKISPQSINRCCMVIEQDRETEPVYTYNRLFSPVSDRLTPRPGSVPADHSASDDTICPSFIQARLSGQFDSDDTYRLPEEHFRTREVYALSTKLAVERTTSPRLLKSCSLQNLHCTSSRENSPSPSPSAKISYSPEGSSTILSRRARRRFFRRSPRPEQDADSDQSTHEHCPSPEIWGFGMITSPTVRHLRISPPPLSPDNHVYHTMDFKQASPLVTRLANDGRLTPTSAMLSPNSKRPLPPAPFSTPASAGATSVHRHHYEEIDLPTRPAK